VNAGTKTLRHELKPLFRERIDWGILSDHNPIRIGGPSSVKIVLRKTRRVAIEEQLMPGIRYGFYLRPSFAMSRAQAEIHDLLRRQFNLRVGGMFMPHATIKGFFKSEAAPEEIISRLDVFLAGRSPFMVYNNGFVPFLRGGIGLIIQNLPDGSPNAELQAFHEAAMDALEPVISPDCERSKAEWVRERFVAHLTLAMADIPEWGFDAVLAFTSQAQPIGPDSFLADSFDLFAFESHDWHGEWWQDFSWTWLRGWTLRASD